MDNQWKRETCETCNFVVEWEGCCASRQPYGLCRKNPLAGDDQIAFYPIVYEVTNACSQWRAEQ